jgi:DNA-binding MarR family transcriptional regulator
MCRWYTAHDLLACSCNLKGLYLTKQVSVKRGAAASPREALDTAENTGVARLPDEALVPVWVGMLRVHHLVVDQLDAILQAKHHIPLSSYEALLHLSFQPEQRMRLSALAASVVLTQSGISRLTDRLEKAGLVRREPSPGDGRGAFAALTEDGRVLVHEAEATHLAAVRAYFLDYLTAEEGATLAQVWERLLSQKAPGAACEG